MTATLRFPRVRFWLVWLLARHPRLKPMFPPVSDDALSQADFLCSAGYHVAAAMLARLAVETKLKEVLMRQPNWHDCPYSSPRGYLRFLAYGERLPIKTSRKVEKFYTRANRLSHGNADLAAYDQCLAIVREARWAVDALETETICPTRPVAVEGGAA